jgi:hypothetical protein
LFLGDFSKQEIFFQGDFFPAGFFPWAIFTGGFFRGGWVNLGFLLRPKIKIAVVPVTRPTLRFAPKKKQPPTQIILLGIFFRLFSCFQLPFCALSLCQKASIFKYFQKDCLWTTLYQTSCIRGALFLEDCRCLFEIIDMSLLGK